MKWQVVIFSSLLVISRTAIGTAECDATRKPFLDKEFVILKSTAAFKEATRSAAKAASELGVRLNFRGLSPDLRTGLTFSKEECAQREFPYPCYVPRGRWDDGAYVSVEWSSKYDFSARGLYLVVVASGAAGSRATRRMLEATRRLYPDAYAKQTRVYVGCMH